MSLSFFVQSQSLMFASNLGALLELEMTPDIKLISYHNSLSTYKRKQTSMNYIFLTFWPGLLFILFHYTQLYKTSHTLYDTIDLLWFLIQFRRKDIMKAISFTIKC